MTAILDLPEVRERAFRWNVEDYERVAELGVFPKRAELIRGFIVTNIAKSPLHRALTKRIYDLFFALRLAGFVIFQESPLRLSDSEPEPDVSIVRGGEGDFGARHPDRASLVVEVAVSSPALDRENASLYAEAEVAEYWIVLGQEQVVEVYRRPADGVYQEKRTYSARETIVCQSVPGVVAPLAEWFA